MVLAGAGRAKRHSYEAVHAGPVSGLHSELVVLGNPLHRVRVPAHQPGAESNHPETVGVTPPAPVGKHTPVIRAKLQPSELLVGGDHVLLHDHESLALRPQVAEQAPIGGRAAAYFHQGGRSLQGFPRLGSQHPLDVGDHDVHLSSAPTWVPPNAQRTSALVVAVFSRSAINRPTSWSMAVLVNLTPGLRPALSAFSSVSVFCSAVWPSCSNRSMVRQPSSSISAASTSKPPGPISSSSSSVSMSSLSPVLPAVIQASAARRLRRWVTTTTNLSGFFSACSCASLSRRMYRPRKSLNDSPPGAAPSPSVPSMSRTRSQVSSAGLPCPLPR